MRKVLPPPLLLLSLKKKPLTSFEMFLVPSLRQHSFHLRIATWALVTFLFGLPLFG